MAELRSLEEQFQYAERLFVGLDSGRDTTSESYMEDVKQAIREFDRVGELIRENTVFSPNETLKDINTQELRYILAPTYLGHLVLLMQDQDRKIHYLNAAEEYIKMFLGQCKKFEILNSEDDMTFEGTEPLDGNDRRMFKINRFKRESAAKAKLKEITAYLAKNASLDATRDCGMERDHVLALIATWIARSCDSLSLLRQERDMLVKIAEMREVHGGKLPAPAPSKTSFKPFTITKEMVKVFGRGYPSPYTMTVEQAAAKEHDMGWHNHSHSNHGKTEDDGEGDLSLEQDNRAGYEACDAKTYKSRKWDAHTDVTPSGIGNRYNKS